MSIRTCPLLILLLAALLVLPGAAAAWELRLTNDDFEQRNPAISGTKVVWQERQNLDDDWDIVLYDGMTGQIRQLTDDLKDQVNPQIAGRYVVWEDYRNSQALENPDIYLLDLEAGGEPVMVNLPDSLFGGYECSPAISDDDGVIVTWIDKVESETSNQSEPKRSEQGRIFFREIGVSGGPRQAYQDSNTQTKPWVSGKKLVWTDTDFGGVYFRHLQDDSTRVLERMSNESIDRLRSSGDRIVWSQYNSDQWDWNIRICELDLDLQNGTKRWLSPSESFQTHPAIDGNLVVWSDARRDSGDIYLFDIAANEERPLVSAESQQFETAIDGEIVAFTDLRDGYEIYLAGARSTTPLFGVVTVPGGTGVPGDTNGDGICEDVNGNGRKDFADVVLYFNQMSWIAGHEPVPRFDFNRNGRIDFADVVWLFNAL